MAKNYINEAFDTPLTNATGSAVTSGDPIQVGSLNGVWTEDVAAGGVGGVRLVGKFAFGKKAASSGQDFGEGVPLYIDTGVLSKVQPQGTPPVYAIATAAATSTDTTCEARLVN